MSSVVGVDDATRSGPAIANGHTQRVDHKCGLGLRIYRPAHNPAAERIKHCAAVQPPFTRTVLRDFVVPQLIWCEPVELAVDQIIGGGHAAQSLDPHRSGQAVDAGRRWGGRTTSGR